MELKNFKKGNHVVMFNCMEAKHPNNYGKIWECETDSFERNQASGEKVFLKGFSGSFSCKYLQFLDLKKAK